VASEDWGKRYGRPVRLVQESHTPATRIKTTGRDTDTVLEHFRRDAPHLQSGQQVQALRLIFLQNDFTDLAGAIRWRSDEDGGLLPTATAVISPYEASARYGRRGHATRWRGHLTHVSETCDDDHVNVISDVATAAATGPQPLGLGGEAQSLSWGAGYHLCAVRSRFPVLVSCLLFGGPSAVIEPVLEPLVLVGRHLIVVVLCVLSVGRRCLVC
jgi:hypothetical protein